MTTVRVNRKAADRAASGHPWIFSSDVVDRGDAAPGDAVKVLDPRSKFLGTAHYSSTSQITLRLLSDKAETLDRGFFLKRITAALKHRETHALKDLRTGLPAKTAILSARDLGREPRTLADLAEIARSIKDLTAGPFP